MHKFLQSKLELFEIHPPIESEHFDGFDGVPGTEDSQQGTLAKVPVDNLVLL